jgi:hypothetical protein
VLAFFLGLESSEHSSGCGCELWSFHSKRYFRNDRPVEEKLTADSNTAAKKTTKALKAAGKMLQRLEPPRP